MSSPAYTIYHRTINYSLLVILLLSFAAAIFQFLLQFNTGKKQQQQQLAMFSQQVDAQLQPVLLFADAVKTRAQKGFQLASPSEQPIHLLSLSTSDVSLHQLNADSQPLSLELQMLGQLQPYFDIAPASISTLKGLFYVSEQGFAYNGLPRWSDYVVEQLVAWLQGSDHLENGYDRNPVFHRDFILDRAAMSVPLYVEGRKTGRFFLALELAPLLASLNKNNPDQYFLLLDQAGEIVAGSGFINEVNLEQYQLQIQSLAGLPWSLALINKKFDGFGAGLGRFLLYWLSYATVLLVLAWLLGQRYKQKIIGPLQRLSVHIDRLAGGQPGVRRIPEGWQELFEKVAQLKKDDKQNID